MKFAKEFLGVPDGEVYPKTFQPGDECPPELMEAAVELGALEPVEEPKANSKAPENKAAAPADKK